MSVLYLVATPIGNLEDISARALRVLREVPLIAAEDTRHTGKLLAHFEIPRKTLVSFHDHNEAEREVEILAALEHGDVALVSDAGTPLINDPGYGLVRAAAAAGYMVTPIPGPSAPIAALSASGLPTDTFLYLGYLPRKASARRSLLKDVAGLPYTLVFLETPHRVQAALADLLAVLGDRPAAIARELTKLHEEIFRGTLSEARAHFQQQAPRGEFTLVIAGYGGGYAGGYAGVEPSGVSGVEEIMEETSGRWSEPRLQAAIAAGLAAGESPSQLAKQLARQSGWPRRDVYQVILQQSG